MAKTSNLVLVQVLFPDELLKKIDSRSRVKGDRSQFIRSACDEKLKALEEAAGK